MKDAAHPEPPRPDPADAAHRIGEGVRDLARGALGAASDLATDVATGYRKSTRYFKLRAAIVAAWVLLALVTLWIAAAPSGPSNVLGARAQLLTGSIMGSQVSVENESSRMWRDVVVTLEGGWRHEKRTIRPAETLVVPLDRFAKDGASAPSTLTPRTITIECAEGRVTIPLPVVR
jgi:hypothetical protein